MKCRKCGCELTGNEKFCPTCGSMVTKVCLICGAELTEGIKFCPSCGTKIENACTGNIENKIDKPIDNMPGLGSHVESVQSNVDDISNGIDLIKDNERTLENTEKHYEAWEKTSEVEIIWKKTDYYQKQFDEIRNGKKGKINWASFFLGLFHAGYRNVWKEWLKGPGIPQIVTIVALILGGIATLVSGELDLMVFIAGITGIAQIVGVVLHIRFALRFNQIYEKHVADKINKKDHRPDPSVLRAILVSVILGAALGIGQGVYGAGSIGAVFSTASMDAGTDLSEILTLEKSDIVKFMNKNGFIDESDLGMYIRGDIWILLDENGNVDMVNLEASDYSIYGLRVGDALSVKGVSSRLSTYGYSLLGEYDGEIIYGVSDGSGNFGGDNLLDIQVDENNIAQRILYSKAGAAETADSIREAEDEYVITDNNISGNVESDNNLANAKADGYYEEELGLYAGMDLCVGNCDGSVALRAEPFVDGEEITRIPIGSWVTYLGLGENGYYQVQYYDTSGWVSGYVLGLYLSAVSVELTPEDVVNTVYGANSTDIVMELGEYSDINNIYVCFWQGDNLLWSGDLRRTQKLDYGGIVLMFNGYNYVENSTDYLEVEWSMAEAIDFPTVYHESDMIGLSDTYSYSYTLSGN